jgi:hypothetical protein
MALLYVLATVGLLTLLALAGLAVGLVLLEIAQHESTDDVDSPLSAAEHFQSKAWQAMQELHDLGATGKSE